MVEIIGGVVIGLLIQGGIYKLLTKLGVSEYGALLLSGFVFATFYAVVGAFGAADGGPLNFVWSLSVGIPSALIVSGLIYFGIWRKSPDKKLRTIIGAIVGFALVSFAANHFLTEIRVADEVNRQMMREASGVRQGLPKKLNEYITMVSIKVEKHTYIYNYEFDYTLKEFGGDAWVDKTKRQVTDAACSAKEMRYLLDYGGGYRYIYKDKSRDVVFDETVIKSSCR